MLQFWATWAKDLLVLRRDRAGLLILFLMPAVLVLVISLVQNNVLERSGGSDLRVLFVDADGSPFSRQLGERLGAVEALRLITREDGAVLTPERVRTLVAAGDYPCGVIIPPGAGAALAERVRALAAQIGGVPGPPAVGGSEVVLCFDPTVQGIFRTALKSALGQVLLGLEVEAKARELSRSLGGGFAGGALGGGDQALRMLAGERLLTLQVESTAPGQKPTVPNAVQQNVPAWALFGMFFIVVPLSGALMRERHEGTLLRLRTLPVSYGVILLGKIAAFVCVCLVQFSGMLLVGRYLLPRFGTPALELQGHLGAAFGLAFCAALAATGYGLLVGSAARSYEQGAMFGAISVVVAAAVGGIMVPVYAMPAAMQTLSVVSPLGWGLRGFLEIFVRGGDFAAVAGPAAALLAFFAGSLLLAWLFLARAGSRGR